MMPAYDWDNPYANIGGSTGVARALQQQQRNLVEQQAAYEKQRLRERIRELDYKVSDLEGKIYGMRGVTGPRGETGMVSLTTPYSTYREAPEPSVEIIDHSLQAPRWWVKLKNDPIWEFFKRPTFKNWLT